jgi:hypothetical protein
MSRKVFQRFVFLESCLMTLVQTQWQSSAKHSYSSLAFLYSPNLLGLDLSGTRSVLAFPLHSLMRSLQMLPISTFVFSYLSQIGELTLLHNKFPLNIYLSI